MRVPIKISVDYTLDFFTLTIWHKRIGELVRRGDALLSYETQKENVDLAADVDGTLAEIIISAEEQISRPPDIAHGGWGGTVGYIETETVQNNTPDKDDKISELKKESNTTVQEKPKQKIRVRIKPDGSVEEVLPLEIKEIKIAPEIHIEAGVLKASPMVRKVALEKNIDLSTIFGTGPDGTIILSDLKPRTSISDLKPLAAGTEEFELVPLTARRKGIASNLEKSWKEIPHAGSEVIVDLSRIASMREIFKKRYATDPPFAKMLSRWDPFLLHAIIHNLKNKWRVINSTFTREGIKLHKHINMGISLADRHGLIVPVIHNAETMGLEGLAYALDNLYNAVSQNKLTAKDYRNATITFNNPGALGGHNGSSIIPYDSGSAIVSLHTINQDSKTILGIRFDHRAYDGFEALGFLNDVKNFLENLDENIL